MASNIGDASCSQMRYGLGLDRKTRLRNKNTCVCVCVCVCVCTCCVQHWLKKLVITTSV